MLTEAGRIIFTHARYAALAPKMDRLLELLLDSSEEEEEEPEGGYHCEFVNPPPDAFQAECPICLQILKEPCVIDCPCGQKMCRECVERIKKEGKPCPLCNKTDFSFMRDYGLERYLKSCDVWCSKKKDGCEWRGKLGGFEQHLNRNPSPDNQLNGCQFVEVECKHECGRWFQRRYIATHQNQECLERPYSCEHCNDYDSTFKEVTDIHYAECPKYPVTCPNECRHDPFERQEIEDHLEDDCPLAKVSCPLHYAGCEVELPRKDMPEHMKDTVTHLTLLANVTLSLMKENQELKEKQRATEEKQRATEEKQRATEEKQIVTEEKQRVTEEKQIVTEEKQRVAEEKQRVTEKEVAVLKEETRQLMLTLGGFPIDFKVNYASREKVAYLPSFYTHPHGYRMCLEVDPKGSQSGKGTHVSVYTHLMKGQLFDDHLKWPFRGEITIQIVNQDGDHDHVERTIPYNDETPDVNARRVTGNKERAIGRGFPQFLAHTDLEYNGAKKAKYLEDDIIIVRVVRVKIT